jgi:phosphoribosyl 1,2-cyclic phosphodiesterase
MRVVFWGTRGSIPVALSAEEVSYKIRTALLAARGWMLDDDEKIRAFVESHLPFAVGQSYGGDTSCVQVDCGGPEYMVCDLGTGLRNFGTEVIARHGPRVANTFHVLLSHPHWDHIMGLPLFTPAYIPGNRIIVHGCHADIEQALRTQNAAPHFPVDFSQLRASFEFDRLEPDRPVEIAGCRVTPKKQLHSGDSYGYRIERGGKTVVYSTDSEHRMDDPAEVEGIVAFFRAADLVIFDAMYSLAESVSVKEDWGHSSNVVAVELSQMAGARHLCLFHHEPAYDDALIASVLAETVRLEKITRGERPLRISAAYDGLVIEV